MPSEQNAEVEVTYTFSHEDYLHFIDFWLKLNRRTYLRQTAQVLALLFVGYVVLFRLSNLPVGFAAALAAVLAMICTGLMRMAKRRRMKRVKEHALGERKTRIGPDGIFGRFPEFEILNYWKGITRIAEDESYLFYFTSGSRAHVVPKRAFATTHDLDQFREAANTYWNASRG